MDIQNKIDYPWVTFMIRGEYYCVSSEYVSQIIMQSTLSSIPQSPPYMLGLLNLYGTVFPIVSLRSLFDIPTLKFEIDQFASMYEQCVSWVSSLIQAVTSNSVFTLSKEYSQFLFSVWKNTYKTDNTLLDRLLERIEDAIIQMCEQAKIIDKHNEDSSDTSNIENALDKAKNLCYNTISPSFDELVSAYESINKGVIILLKHTEMNLGILVDSIATIENFELSLSDNAPLKMGNNPYVKNIIISNDNTVLYFELNVDTIAVLGKEYQD